MRHEELSRTLQRLAQDAHYLAIHLNGPLDIAEIDCAYEACAELAAHLTDLAMRVEVNGTSA